MIQMGAHLISAMGGSIHKMLPQSDWNLKGTLNGLILRVAHTPTVWRWGWVEEPCQAAQVLTSSVSCETFKNVKA